MAVRCGVHLQIKNSTNGKKHLIETLHAEFYKSILKVYRCAKNNVCRANIHWLWKYRKGQWHSWNTVTPSSLWSPAIPKKLILSLNSSATTVGRHRQTWLPKEKQTVPPLRARNSRGSCTSWHSAKYEDIRRNYFIKIGDVLPEFLLASNEERLSYLIRVMSMPIKLLFNLNMREKETCYGYPSYTFMWLETAWCAFVHFLSVPITFFIFRKHHKEGRAG